MTDFLKNTPRHHLEVTSYISRTFDFVCLCFGSVGCDSDTDIHT